MFAALDGGWQGQLEERGRGLSGGQRQRVVLARVLARDPEILILVEPTSAVDAHTEAMIAERLAEYRPDRTTIITTTSPLLLHHADRVALLSGESVAAYGTHEELLRDNRRVPLGGGPGARRRGRCAMTELHTGLRNSAETWRSTPPPPRVPGRADPARGPARPRTG